MKKILPAAGKFILLLFFLTSQSSKAQQCNVNEKYDKIVSGYHSSIALKDNGGYSVWGSYMKQAGNADQLSPQDISVANYTTLTGTIYKATLGGGAGGAQVDQAILLTSDGLWAWGPTGRVFSTTIKSTAAFGRITSPSGGVGSTTLGLPTGITPADVQSLFATSQTLILLTKRVSNSGGDVYILTQTSRAAEANGGTPVTTAGSSSWQRVRINGSTFLTNVTAVRGQVYNSSNNAFIALAATGEVYTWGNTSYLGNSTAVAARNYATQMTLPTEFASSIPKMIGVTGGGGTGATTTGNTYYILSEAGNLYSLGNNSQRQCGDFTTTERTSWVQVKKSSAANDFLVNVNFFSAQEHNSSFPSVAAITNNGTLYTWGNNSSGMIGRTDNGAAGGGLTTVAFDPGIPVGFTNTAIFVEMGGHTMVYTIEGSSKFCYVGHYTNGSMGDGTSGNNGASSATSLKHDCNSTPSINICGYVPVAGSVVQSTISVSEPLIYANGTSTSVVTIQLKDASGNNLTSSGGNVVIYTDAGTVGAVTDNNDGTYTAVLTSSTSPGTATISFSINGNNSSNTSSVMFAATLPVKWGNVFAYRQNSNVKIDWTTLQEVNVSHFDVERSLNGNDWLVIIPGVPAANRMVSQKYLQTDPQYHTQRIFYRIRQVDQDGRFTYSPVVMVGPEQGKNNIVAYPVPAQSGFFLANVNPNEVRQVALYNSNGVMVKRWQTAQTSYSIETLPPGVYVVKVTTLDNNTQHLRISKQ